MRAYSAEFKTRLIEQRLPPPNADVVQLARETGIPKDTLYSWRCQARQAPGLSIPSQENKSAERWSSEAKFAVVIETAALHEAELGEYGRQRGWYPEQGQAWRRVGEQAHQGAGRPRRSRPIGGGFGNWSARYDAKRRPWPKRPPCGYGEKKPLRVLRQDADG